MSDAAAPEGAAASTARAQEQAIREQVRDLTARMLAGGQIDTEGVKAVVRPMSGGALAPPIDSDQARVAFAEAIRGLDQALQDSAQATHQALQAIIARGKDFSDNDLKNAFAALQKMQEDYVATANHVADATTGNIRRELADLALHAQRVGADASVRVAQLMSEFANRMSGSYRGRAISGLEAARDVGANMTMLTSGMLAGFADALRQQSEAKKPK
jgi:phosphoribosyl-ATP pyrophosphohydrolase